MIKKDSFVDIWLQIHHKFNTQTHISNVYTLSKLYFNSDVKFFKVFIYLSNELNYLKYLREFFKIVLNKVNQCFKF